MTEISRIAREGLGVEELRPGQAEAVEAAAAGRDASMAGSTTARSSV